MTPIERLSIIAEAFAVVDDPTMDGNRAANARQRIRDAVAGHVVHVVSAETYAAAQERAEKAEMTEQAARRDVDNALTDLIMMKSKAREAMEAIAALTADNAALRAALSSVRPSLNAAPVDTESK